MRDAFKQCVVLNPDQRMNSLPLTAAIHEVLDRNCQGFKPHALVVAHHFTETWPDWKFTSTEEELAVLMSGSAAFKLRNAQGDESGCLDDPAAFVVVPGNTWHTAIFSEPGRLLFITPGAGTLNQTSPPADN